MTPTASTYVVLGLLARRPGSGYDVAAFADKTIRHFWPVSRSQLYAELSRLEELGWASGTTVAQDRYPTKRVYEPTPEGMAALREWLDDPPPQHRQRSKGGIVLRTFLGSLMSAGRLAEQLREHREQAERMRDELAAVVEHLAAKGPDGPHRFGLAAARHGVLQAEATIAWTAEVQALLEAQRPAEPR